MRNLILVVEDDEAIQENLRLMFETEGYSVVTASNGEEALGFLAHSSIIPCVVFLDLMMPVMDGEEFLCRLDEEMPQLARKLQVVVLTAARLSRERASWLQSRTKAIVAKPFSIDTVLDAAQNYAASA